MGKNENFNYYRKSNSIRRVGATLIEIILFFLLTNTNLFKNQLLSEILLFAYPLFVIFFESYFGCFIGKFIFGLRVINFDDNNNISIIQSFVRFFSKYIGIWFTLGSIVIYSFIKIRKDNYGQTNSDEIVGSIVVLFKDKKKLSVEKNNQDYFFQDYLSETDLAITAEETDILPIIKSFNLLKKITFQLWFCCVLFTIISVLTVNDFFRFYYFGLQKTWKNLILLFIVLVLFSTFSYLIKLTKKGKRIYLFLSLGISLLIPIILGVLYYVNGDLNISSVLLTLVIGVLLCYYPFRVIRLDKNVLSKSAKVYQYNNFTFKALKYIKSFKEKSLSSIFWQNFLLLIIIFLSLVLVGLLFTAMILSVLTGAFLGPIIWVFIPVFSYAINKTYAYFKRVGKKTYNKMKDTQQAELFVFIRSFDDDRISVATEFSFKKNYLDEVLDNFFSNDKLSLGIGIPGDYLPPLGVTRYYVNENENWENKIKEFLLNAEAIFTICAVSSNGQGLEKEYKMVEELGLLDKVIFIIPPLSSKEMARRLIFVCNCFERLKNKIPFLLSQIGKIIAFKITEDDVIKIVNVENDELDNPLNYYSNKNTYKVALMSIQEE